MGLYEHWPYVNFHELNMDWIIQLIKTFQAEYAQFKIDWANIQDDWEAQQQAFAALQQFVTDYFDNLDVQQEINNKLDEMAENGTLWNLMQPYVDQELEFLKIYTTPEEYGAAGDGTTNDSNAVRQALDSGRNVYFGKTYLIEDKITTVLNDVELFGHGTLLFNDQEANEFILDISGENISVDGLTFEAVEYTEMNNTSAGNGIKIHNVKDIDLENCSFIAHNAKVNGLLDFYNNWENVYLRNCVFDVNTFYENAYHGGGIWVRSFNDELCKNLTVDGCTFKAETRDECIAVWNGTGYYIENVDFINNKLEGYNMPHLTTFAGVKNLIISNCLFDGEPVNSYLKLYYNSQTNENENISGCVWNSSASALAVNNGNLEMTDVYNSLLKGKIRGDHTRFRGCTMISSQKTDAIANSELYDCYLDIQQSGNQCFSYSTKIYNCKIIFGGPLIQTFSNSAVVEIVNSQIETKADASANVFIGRQGAKYTIKNNIFTGAVMPSFGSFLSTDVVMNNLFAASVGYPTDRPIGADANNNTNLVG